VSYLEQDVKESRNGVSGKSGAAGGEGVLSLKLRSSGTHPHTDRPRLPLALAKVGALSDQGPTTNSTPHARTHARRLHAKRKVLLSHAAAAPSSPPHIAPPFATARRLGLVPNACLCLLLALSLSGCLSARPSALLVPLLLPASAPSCRSPLTWPPPIRAPKTIPSPNNPMPNPISPAEPRLHPTSPTLACVTQPQA
jgi:hypothetical protein